MNSFNKTKVFQKTEKKKGRKEGSGPSQSKHRPRGKEQCPCGRWCHLNQGLSELLYFPLQQYTSKAFSLSKAVVLFPKTSQHHKVMRSVTATLTPSILYRQHFTWKCRRFFFFFFSLFHLSGLCFPISVPVLITLVLSRKCFFCSLELSASLFFLQVPHGEFPFFLIQCLSIKEGKKKRILDSSCLVSEIY